MLSTGKPGLVGKRMTQELMLRNRTGGTPPEMGPLILLVMVLPMSDQGSDTNGWQPGASGFVEKPKQHHSPAPTIKPAAQFSETVRFAGYPSVAFADVVFGKKVSM